ncbi:MAG TPA: HAMP domain-containing histidine kinase [Erysipelothrix sp.]|jgi:two-component system phosphate regulon sensor histidine kinase PhoR|nr:HAMP domain-containing histidine kinase [Erysipelothrix sp.]
MFSKFNHIKVVLWLILLLLCISPFQFELKIELTIGLLVIIAIILLHFILLPKTQVDLKNQLIHAEMKNINLARQLDEFLMTIPIPLVVIDNNLNVLVSNLAYKQTFLNHRQDLKRLEYQLKATINQAVRSTGSTRVTIFFDSREYLMVTSHLNYNNQLSTLLVFSDITSFMDAQKAQKRFIADASHELKTPITSIKGISELLVTHDMDHVTQNEFLSQISKESNRLQLIVHDLLELSRLSSNRLILNHTSFNFSDLVKEVYHGLRTLLLSKNLNFIYDFSNQPVFLDYERMHQVLNNLLNNAINYSDEGKIELIAYHTDSEFVITISDQGIGIDEKHHPYLFDRFYRIDEARNRQVGGSGLGLSIVKEIIEAHGGEIRVQNNDGGGTQFVISLPLKN